MAQSNPEIEQIIDDITLGTSVGMSIPSVKFHRQDLKPGMLLDEKYEIKCMLGKGGMGAVYKAFDVTMQRHVAIKVILSAYSSIAAFRKRFQKEAISMAKVSSDNVVRIYNCEVREDGLCYIVMEYIEGETLGSLLAREGKLSPAKAVSLCRQILLALHAIHQKSMIHRDLKPANIMLTLTDRGLRVRICDFGLGKEFEDTDSGEVHTQLTEAGLILGTPKYMSPEQCVGDKLEQASDIYSLGIIFFEMLTGHAPFQGGSKLSIIGQHLRRTVPIEKLGADVPKSVRDVLTKALMKDHQERYLDSVSMMRGFNAARARPVIHRRSVARIALVAVVMLLTIGIGGFMVLGALSPSRDAASLLKPQKVSAHIPDQSLKASYAMKAIEPVVEVKPAHEDVSSSVAHTPMEWPQDAKTLFHQAQSYSDLGNKKLYNESLKRFLASCKGKRNKACSPANRSFARMRYSPKSQR